MKIANIWIAFMLGMVVALDAKADIVATFDNENAQNNYQGVLYYGAFDYFDVTSGNVDLIGNGYFDIQPGHGLYVDLNGDTAGTLTSKMQVAPGSYVLKYDLYNPAVTNTQTSTGKVSLGTFSQNFDTHTNSFVTFINQITLTASANLVFQSTIPGNQGPILDNIRLTSAVPEPSTILLLALFASIAFSLRKCARLGCRTKRESLEAA